MAGLADLEKNVAKLKKANEDTRAITREAHEAIKTIKQLLKEIKEERGRWEIGIKEVLDKIIEDRVKTGLDEYAETIRTATATAHQHVIDEFEKLTNLMLYGNEKGRGVSVIEEWVQKVVRDSIKEMTGRN